VTSCTPFHDRVAEGTLSGGREEAALRPPTTMSRPAPRAAQQAVASAASSSRRNAPSRPAPERLVTLALRTDGPFGVMLWTGALDIQCTFSC
jgi:hypothetical protein